MTIKTGEKMYASDILNLTFFPKGTILTFSTEAWNNATNPGFKDIWKVCDGQNGTPNLVNMFLRGAGSSGATGGANSQSVTAAQLPAHNHGATGLSVSGLSLSPLSLTNMAISGLTVSGGGHEHTLSGGTSLTAHSHTGSGTTTTGSGVHWHNVSGSTNSTSKTLTGRFGLVDDARGRIDNSGVFTYADWSGDSWGNAGGRRTIVNMDVTHSHNISGSTPASEGGHSHDVSVTITDNGSHAHDFTSTSKAVSTTHEHTISGGAITGSITGGAVTGGSIDGSTASFGSNSALVINTVPAYYTVIYIMKVV